MPSRVDPKYVKGKDVLGQDFGHVRALCVRNLRGSASSPMALDVLPMPLGSFKKAPPN
jgi:hypothetical protein